MSILIINGSASDGSSNQRLINKVAESLSEFDVIVYNSLKTLPHFDPKLSGSNPPGEIIDFRKKVEEAKAVIICTPEYIFSIPSGLKNAIEWCISTTVFSEKPLGIITASALGEEGHAELQLIMRTAMAKFNEGTTWLIPGIKSKISEDGEIIDENTRQELKAFADSMRNLIASS